MTLAHGASLVSRLLPVFQCCTKKNGKPGKTHHVNDVANKLNLALASLQARAISS